jgi:hypothetical protein
METKQERYSNISSKFNGEYTTKNGNILIKHHGHVFIENLFEGYIDMYSETEKQGYYVSEWNGGFIIKMDYKTFRIYQNGKLLFEKEGN